MNYQAMERPGKISHASHKEVSVKRLQLFKYIILTQWKEIVGLGDTERRWVKHMGYLGKQD